MSDVQGRVETFRGVDMPWLLRLRSETHTEQPFLIWAPFDKPAETWTYGRFHERVGALSAGLAKRGVKPRECVLLHLDNCIELLIAWFACVELGAIAVTTNTRSAGAEIEYFADHCGAVAAITQPRYADLVSRHCKGLRWMAVTAHDAGAEPEPGQGAPGSERFEALFADAADRPRRPADAMAPCSVQYTSGTTSRPKAVLWTHANALWGAKINAVHEDLRPTDRHLITMPLFHTNALAYSMLATLWTGASAVVQPRFSASRFWDVAVRHGCTWTSMVPFCSKALADREIPEKHSFRLWGGGVASPPTDALFRVKTMGWWGMTETITHGIVSDPNLPCRSMMIGRPAPEYAIRIVNDDGSATEPGQAGNLLIKGVRGVSLFVEYMNNAKATAESYDEHGYFITGDRVVLHEDGLIQFGDRAKDMLKVGGENVSASEIETVVAKVPGVREAAVVAKKDRMLDEVPAVFVIPEAMGEDARARLPEAILEACRGALADFKVPREVRLVDSMPRSTLEKIAKAELRKLLDAAG